MLRYSAILLSALTLASAGPLSAQVITKPRSPTDRLPKPAGVSSAQEPDGRIRVVWRAVDGAVRYKLIRSVPPAASTALTLPNPSDTQYVDGDVKPGSYYYYVISAVNEAGIEGLKAGTSLKATPVVAPADTTPALAPVPPPTNVAVKMYDYLQPKVSWQTSVPGSRVLIERREEVDGSVAANATWETAVQVGDKSWSCSTCSFLDGPRPLKGGSLSQYRVTIVEPAPSTRRSEPVTTNKVHVEFIPVAPTEIHQIWLVKGQSEQLFFRPSDVPGVQYVSLDSNTVSLPRPGVVMAKEFGMTYVTAVARLPDGKIKSWIWQARVSDKPQ